MTHAARTTPTRRRVLAASASAVVSAAASGWLLLHSRNVSAVSTVDSLALVVQRWAGGRPVTEGRVRLEIAELVENGNAVPIRVRVDSSPMTEADHVQEIVVFNEKNPLRDVVRFSFSPASGRAQADTRIRLATSQQLVALARMSDGSQWSHRVEVLVTLAACVES